MISNHVRAFMERLMAQEQCPTRLAFTCALGVFIGISPYAGFHTIMTFVCAWFFSLNIAALFAVSVLIHNPWTMMPVYAIDHMFGKWLFSFMRIDYMHWNPGWVESCNVFLKEHTGIGALSLPAFLVGGTVLALMGSLIMYPIAKRIFTYYLSNPLILSVSKDAN